VVSLYRDGIKISQTAMGGGLIRNTEEASTPSSRPGKGFLPLCFYMAVTADMALPAA